MHKIAPVWKWIIFLVFAAVAIALAFHFDAPVREWILHQRSRAVRHFMQNVSRFGDWPEHVLAGLVGLAIAYWRGQNKWMRLCLTMILACALAGIAAEGGKVATGRTRPSCSNQLGGNGPVL